MSLPYLMDASCMTRIIQIDRIKILMILIHGIHKQKECCLSVAQILSSRYQSWIWRNLNWPHIQHVKCTRRNCLESTYCPEVNYQWDCVLNDLEELRDKQTIAPESSVQYWNLLFIPPPPAAKHAVHRSSNKQRGSENWLCFDRFLVGIQIGW